MRNLIFLVFACWVYSVFVGPANHSRGTRATKLLRIRVSCRKRSKNCNCWSALELVPLLVAKPLFYLFLTSFKLHGKQCIVHIAHSHDRTVPESRLRPLTMANKVAFQVLYCVCTVAVQHPRTQGARTRPSDPVRERRRKCGQRLDPQLPS